MAIGGFADGLLGLFDHILARRPGLLALCDLTEAAMLPSIADTAARALQGGRLVRPLGAPRTAVRHSPTEYAGSASCANQCHALRIGQQNRLVLCLPAKLEGNISTRNSQARMHSHRRRPHFPARRAGSIPGPPLLQQDKNAPFAAVSPLPIV